MYVYIYMNILLAHSSKNISSYLNASNAADHLSFLLPTRTKTSWCETLWEWACPFWLHSHSFLCAEECRNCGRTSVQCNPPTLLGYGFPQSPSSRVGRVGEISTESVVFLGLWAKMAPSSRHENIHASMVPTQLMYIYIYKCVCVCVCFPPLQPPNPQARCNIEMFK